MVHSVFDGREWGEVNVRRLWLAMLLVVVASTAVRAQQPPNEPDLRLVAARKLLEVSGGGRMAVQAAQMVLTSLKKMDPSVPAAIWTEFEAEIKPEEFMELAAPIYAKHFTVEEMQQLQAFYESPLGQKYLQAVPAIMQESMTAGQEYARIIGERILKRLRERGYAGKATGD